MSYMGRAANVKLQTKINGTHTLTFEMPDRFFDNLKGDYVRNEFVDRIFNETKLKLWFKNEWLEFVVKDVQDEKHFKSYMKSYTCTDSFIEELSRNGYGITFDTELYNNVEEIGVFTEEILDGSVWVYSPQYNWGDFTEYLEEKLFKVPVSMFKTLVGAKLNFHIDTTDVIENVYTHKKRPVEMGDDYARVKGYYWDALVDGNIVNPLSVESEIPNDGYIYIPYSQLQFCYNTTSDDHNWAATEEIQTYNDMSYAICPTTIDPNALIQFIAVPANEKIEIDEAGLIVSKNYTYVMTVAQWNENVNSTAFYQFLPENEPKHYFPSKINITYDNKARGNRAIGYEGYLDKLGDLDVLYGKKISISDRTVANPTEEIDQYVKVYNAPSITYDELYATNENWVGSNGNYRVCSKTETRFVVPQLAQNFIQNGTNISSADGWEAQKLYSPNNLSEVAQPLTISYLAPNIAIDLTDEVPLETDEKISGRIFVNGSGGGNWEKEYVPALFTVLNFGVAAQDKKIESNKIYCLGISFSPLVKTIQEKYSTTHIEDSFSDDLSDVSLAVKKYEVVIGKGGVESEGDYLLSNTVTIPLEQFVDIDNIGNYVSDNRTIFTAYLLIKFDKEIENPYVGLRYKTKGGFQCIIQSMELFEAYTKGIDAFNDGKYRYSGRDLFEDGLTAQGTGYVCSTPYSKTKIKREVLFELDIMDGGAYEYEKYFIQQGVAGNFHCDTFGKTEILGIDPNKAIFDSSLYAEEDCNINTKYIDLTKCRYFNSNATHSEPDCSYGGEERICLYQKYGYCPYLFQTEKHCRKIRTLTGEKSNRFNLTQELSKVFEIYPVYWIEHDNVGKTLTHTIQEKDYNEDGSEFLVDKERQKKQIFYIREKGMENPIGFRYQKNLSSISRTIKSDQIVTKLYVEDVDSDLSKTGLCSIKTAPDNPTKDNFIINLDYYTTKGLLDKDLVIKDLYGVDPNDLGYFKKLAHLNDEYDKLSNAIINLQTGSLTELEANLQVNLNGIDSAKKELGKLHKNLDYYKGKLKDESAIEENNTYISYKMKIQEMLGKLHSLIFTTFITENNNAGNSITYAYGDSGAADDKLTAITNMKAILDESGETYAEFIKGDWYKNHTYNYGMLGQFNAESKQIAEWKKSQAVLLKRINALSLKFFRKYEPYLKEGTWTDNNYIDDNAYYFGAQEVAADGSIPKVEYNISVVDLISLPNNDELEFNLADTTYVEDIGMFGYNKNGMPNRLKVLISSINYDLDEPKSTSIGIQNFTTQFEDLFQQVTASVQSLSFNENIYKRATNFTANKNIQKDSLQGTLDTNDLTLLNTDEKNIEIDKNGQSGSDINNHNNKYKLNGEGLFFSNNGGETWNTGVGPSGINADYIRTGTLDAGKIRIVDNNYLYFLWDKGGIYAYREPTGVENQNPFNDYALYNKYGLSLVEGGKIRLRAGYEFNGNQGEITSESSIGDNVGFYLYDKNGRTIFATQAGSSGSNDESEVDESASILLKGEMFISDANIDVSRKVISAYRYSGDCYQLTKENNGIAVEDYNYFANIQNTVENITSNNNITTLELRDNYSPTNSMLDYILYALNEYKGTTIEIQSLVDGLETITTVDSITVSFEDIKFVKEIGSEQVGSRQYCRFILRCMVGGVQQEYTLRSDIYLRYVPTFNVDSLYKGVYVRLTQNGAKYVLTKLPTNRVRIKMQDVSASAYEWNGQTIELYQVEGILYSQKEILNDKGGSVHKTQSTNLYLNNKISADGGGATREHERLLCCSTQDSGSTDSVQNIFSILKNGFLYIGGTIKDNSGNDLTDSSKVPDTIQVTDEFLSVKYDESKSKWGMYLRFDSLYDSLTGNDLLSVISDSIARMKLIRHRHAIYTLNAAINSNKNTGKNFIYLPAAYSSISQLDQALTRELTLKDFIVGLTTGGTIAGIAFNRKVALCDEMYIYDCEGTFTDYTGSEDEGDGSIDNSDTTYGGLGDGLLLNPASI